MYSRNEAAHLKKEFWTTFGQYMAPVLSAEGEKIAWVNYKTGEKQIFFRLRVDHAEATVAIEITHADEGVQQVYYEQFVQLKKILEEITGEVWHWRLHGKDENSKTISTILTVLKPVSVYKKEDWPRLITFFKSRIMALDEFWSSVKYSFEMLR